MCLRCLNAPAPSLIHRQHLLQCAGRVLHDKAAWNALGIDIKHGRAQTYINEMQSSSLIKVAAVAAILALGGLGFAHDALACGRFSAVILATAGVSPATSMNMADEYSPGRRPTAMKSPAAPAVGAPS